MATDPPPAPAPTDHPPGSPEKVEVLAERFAAGVALWHPHDGAEQFRRRRGDGPIARKVQEPAVRKILLDALANRPPLRVLARQLGCSEDHAYRLLARVRAEQRDGRRQESRER